VDRTVSAKARKALAASDQTMAALIERVGKIDIATRLKRRSEERPNDAYGALLRAIVGQQLSTKAARTIYLRVIDLFNGSTPTPEQLLEAREEDLRAARQ
jgi:DNA-3-methyladenine glycosylase II